MKVGALVCSEHWMPLARFAMHAKGEEVHVASWPDAPESHHIASRHYAFEGRCFVICAASYLRASDVPDDFELRNLLREGIEVAGDGEEWMPGGSGIIGPDGTWVAGPVFGREEIVTAEVDLERIREEQQALDSVGHYNRPGRLPRHGRRAPAAARHLAGRTARLIGVAALHARRRSRQLRGIPDVRSPRRRPRKPRRVECSSSPRR